MESFPRARDEEREKRQNDLSRDNQILILNGQIYYVINGNLRTLTRKPTAAVVEA